MKRLLALCLFLPLAGMAAAPPASSSTASPAADAAQARMTALQDRMNALAERMAALSAKLGDEANASALRYLADSQRGMLGVAVSHDQGGTRVEAVTPGGPAERAGFEVGDVITAIDGEPLSRNDASVLTALSDLRPGKSVALKVQRDGKTLHLKATPERFSGGDWQATVRAAERAAHDASARVNSPEFQQQIQQTIESATREAANAGRIAMEAGRQASQWNVVVPWWGLNLAPLNPDLGRYFGTDQGALVLSRDAKRFPELEPGDVITDVAGRSVARPQDAMRAFREAPDDQPVAVTVRRHGKPVQMAFKTPPRWLVLPPLPPPAPPAPPAPAAPMAPPPPPAPAAPAPPASVAKLQAS